MDCGPGTVRGLARTGVDWARITDVWISHFHTDHTGDIPGLLWALTWGLMPERRRLPLTFRGPRGIRRRLEAFAAAAGDFVLEPGFPVEVEEVAPGDTVDFGEAGTLRTLKTPHTDESLAVRLDGEVSVVYTGDTGPALPLGEFAAGADLFVCECSLPEDLVADNHLSPRSVARFAATAEPATLLLTHVYPQFRAVADVAALVRAEGFEGEIEMAVEGWTRRFGGGRGSAR
jgi:ribonuclease BN (tRNA processing enzyme)